MLDPQTINKIEEFVYAQPRSIQEIASHLGKNWRTADRYVDEIQREFGTISTKVFRGGTRGALKIVYWASVEKVSPSIFQERLEQDIFASKNKQDFSAFDIFQHISNDKRKIFVQNNEQENLKEFSNILLSAKKQILFFSGNLSFINFKDKKKDLFGIIEKLAEKNVTIKIICRVDLIGKENIEKLLSLNSKYGKNLIEIRNNFQPIRGVILDGKIISLREVKEPTGKLHELNKKVFITYNVYEKSWVEWLSRIFWKKFSNSIDAYKRLENLKLIRL